MCAPGRRGEISFSLFFASLPRLLMRWAGVQKRPMGRNGGGKTGGKEVERYSSQVSGTSLLLHSPSPFPRLCTSSSSSWSSFNIRNSLSFYVEKGRRRIGTSPPLLKAHPIPLRCSISSGSKPIMKFICVVNVQRFLFHRLGILRAFIVPTPQH